MKQGDANQTRRRGVAATLAIAAMTGAGAITLTVPTTTAIADPAPAPPSTTAAPAPAGTNPAPDAAPGPAGPNAAPPAADPVAGPPAVGRWDRLPAALRPGRRPEVQRWDQPDQARHLVLGSYRLAPARRWCSAGRAPDRRSPLS